MDDTNVITIVEELHKTLGLPRAQHNEDHLRVAFNLGLTPLACAIGVYARLTCSFTVRPVQVERSAQKRGFAARIRFSKHVPLHFTQEFARERYEICVAEDLLQYGSFEAITFTLAHEVSHVVLHATRSRLAHSERATEVCAMMLGYEHLSTSGHVFNRDVMVQENIPWWLRLLGHRRRSEMMTIVHYCPHLSEQEYRLVSREIAMLRRMRELSSRTS